MLCPQVELAESTDWTSSCAAEAPRALANCSTKLIYTVLASSRRRRPVAGAAWREEFPDADARGIWRNISVPLMSARAFKLDFKIRHRRIYTGNHPAPGPPEEFGTPFCALPATAIISFDTAEHFNVELQLQTHCTHTLEVVTTTSTTSTRCCHWAVWQHGPEGT